MSNPRDEVFNWIPVMNLSNNKTVLAPTELVVAPLKSRLVHRNADGIACGNSRAEVFLHAVLELIEQDAVSFARLADYAHTIRQGTLPMRAQRMIDSLHKRGIRTTVVKCDAILNMPAYFVVLDDAWSTEPMLVCSGAGAHLDPHIAISRALTKAIQTRACVISGNRKNLEPRFRTFGETVYEQIRRSYERLTDSLDEIEFDDKIHGCLAGTASATARSLIRSMSTMGFELYVRLLSPVNEPMAVISVFGKGFESIDAPGQQVGPRLRRATSERWGG